jgi:hypothetical protein
MAPPVRFGGLSTTSAPVVVASVCLTDAIRSQGFSPSQRLDPTDALRLYFTPQPSTGFGWPPELSSRSQRILADPVNSTSPSRALRKRSAPARTKPERMLRPSFCCNDACSSHSPQRSLSWPSPLRGDPDTPLGRSPPLTRFILRRKRRVLGGPGSRSEGPWVMLREHHLPP